MNLYTKHKYSQSLVKNLLEYKWAYWSRLLSNTKFVVGTLVASVVVTFAIMGLMCRFFHLLFPTLFYFILFYFILIYFILFYFILFYFILFYFILFYFILFYF